MHIRIDEDGTTVAVLCLERGHSHARIVYSEHEHIDKLVQIARVMGAEQVVYEALDEEKDVLLASKFRTSQIYTIMVRSLT